jgi:hypothetical protein
MQKRDHGHCLIVPAVLQVTIVKVPVIRLLLANVLPDIIALVAHPFPLRMNLSQVTTHYQALRMNLLVVLELII